MRDQVKPVVGPSIETRDNSVLKIIQHRNNKVTLSHAWHSWKQNEQVTRQTLVVLIFLNEIVLPKYKKQLISAKKTSQQFKQLKNIA
jgi:hypothetical protein